VVWVFKIFMHGIFQAIIFGIVQGLGEFFPISSTAHLILLPYFTGWPDPGLAFDVALHLGTLLAVLSFFWKDWVKIFQSAKSSLSQGFSGFKKEILFYIIIGTIPGGFLGFLFDKKAETTFRSPLLIAGALIIVGIILYWADKKFKGTRNIKGVSLKDSVIIGLAQAMAIIPGISRSGATISTALWRKLDKVNAARFSFLLSTPIIAGAAMLELPHLFENGLSAFIIFGILSSAISGFLAIKYLLKYLERHSYKLFFLYRLILGLIIFLVYFIKKF